MEVILDTSFIISCIKKKIDFLDQLEQQGYSVRLPLEVFQELKDLRIKTRGEEKIAVNVALELFEKRNTKKIKLGHNKVDVGLIEKGKKGIHIATLDKEIKRNITNPIVIFNAQGKVGPENRSL